MANVKSCVLNWAIGMETFGMLITTTSKWVRSKTITNSHLLENIVEMQVSIWHEKFKTDFIDYPR